MKRAHHDLLAWQQGIALVKVVYQLTSTFPKSELYALTSQMRRAAVSVPANIAEGVARNTTGDFLRFLHIARGSLSELETYVVLARELGYASDTQQIDAHLERVFGLVGGLINSQREPNA